MRLIFHGPGFLSALHGLCWPQQEQGGGCSVPLTRIRHAACRRPHSRAAQRSWRRRLVVGPPWRCRGVAWARATSTRWAGWRSSLQRQVGMGLEGGLHGELPVLSAAACAASVCNKLASVSPQRQQHAPPHAFAGGAPSHLLPAAAGAPAAFAPSAAPAPAAPFVPGAPAGSAPAAAAPGPAVPGGPAAAAGAQAAVAGVAHVAGPPPSLQPLRIPSGPPSSLCSPTSSGLLPGHKFVQEHPAAPYMLPAGAAAAGAPHQPFSTATAPPALGGATQWQPVQPGAAPAGGGLPLGAGANGLPAAPAYAAPAGGQPQWGAVGYGAAAAPHPAAYPQQQQPSWQPGAALSEDMTEVEL